MAIGSGLSAQLGIAEETTYGTFVAPTRFHEFNSEDLTVEVGKARTRGLGQRIQRSNRIRTWITRAGGSFEIDVLNTEAGLLLKQCFGAVAASQPDPVNTPLEHLYTFTLDDDALGGQYATVQVGRPAIDGTVYPFNYVGGKVTAWELMCEVDANLKLNTSWDFKTAETTSALATPTYDFDGLPLSFIDGVLEIDGVEEEVTSVSITGEHAMNVDRRFIGNNRREPLANDEWMYGGGFDMEFEDLDMYNKWINGTLASLTLTFAVADTEIDAGQANPYQLVVTIPALEFEGENPTVDSSDVLTHANPFKILDNGTDEVITVEYHTVVDTTLPAV